MSIGNRLVLSDFFIKWSLFFTSKLKKNKAPNNVSAIENNKKPNEFKTATLDTEHANDNSESPIIKSSKTETPKIEVPSPKVNTHAKKPRPQLIDPYGRKIDYLRFAITDKCNLRCFYCLPTGFNNFSRISLQLTQDEIVRIVRIFTELGVHHVRFTGGEPLLYKDLAALATRFSTLPGLDDLSLSTNASLLVQQAEKLKQAGVNRLNVSLDTLRADRFQKINGGHISDTLDGLMIAKELGFNPIKINMLAMKDVNDDEFEDMVNFCIDNRFTLRFIETMPISAAGRKAYEYYLDLQSVEKRLANNFELIPSIMPGGGPARYVQVKDTALRIGFITPISQHFCNNCNRIRLTSTGTLYLCLGNDHALELREPMRQGQTDAELKTLIINAITKKPESHNFIDKPQQVINFMSKLGG